eukprot:2377366-Amphidinium_carterae.2
MPQARPRSRSRRARATSSGEWRARSALSQNPEADEAVISRQPEGRQQHGLYAEHPGPLHRSSVESQNALCSHELAHLARDADIGSRRGCIASRKGAAGARRLDHPKVEGVRGQPSSRTVEAGTIPRGIAPEHVARSSRSARAANGRKGITHREKPAPKSIRTRREEPAPKSIIVVGSTSPS